MMWSCKCFPQVSIMLIISSATCPPYFYQQQHIPPKTSLIHHCSSIEVTRGFDFTETLCVQNHVQCTCTKNIGVVARVKCLVRFPFLSFFWHLCEFWYGGTCCFLQGYGGIDCFL
jgi:hypothetical protein